MPKPDVRDYERALKDATTVREAELDSCLYRQSSKKSDGTICDFYLIKCLKDDIRERDFLRIIRDIVVRYALRREEYEHVDETNLLRIAKRAKERFTKSPYTGEVGELILFALLESKRNAPQLVNKMSLKTAGGVHILGLDGIHMGVWNDEIRLYYGESKFRKSHDSSIAEAVDDLSDFHRNPMKEEFEMTLISNNIDFSKFRERVDDIKAMLDPYTEDKTLLRRVYAVFIGFNWDSLQEIDFPRIEDGIQELLEECIDEHSIRIAEMCSEKVEGSGIDNLVEFFFIPFKNVEQFRKDFLRLIG